MDEIGYLAIFVVAAPLLGSIIIGLLNKRISRDATNWLACGLIACSFFASLYLLIGFLTGRFQTWDNAIYVWGQSGTLQIPVGFLIDRLTVAMITVVTFVSFTVHVYTIGYMDDDDGYQRFFCYISLFTFSMLMLVMANNLVQLFFGWEAVGLLSYLLIGFWYKKESANFASLKAFLINRIGDLGFILGIAAVMFYFNSLQYKAVFAQATSVLSNNPSAATLICICLFIGAMAKSAQIPLHVWLPDSMEGPTPISALIHAATMVTAGVFMVARMSPLFEYSETALSFVTIIGAITCLFTGILAVIQTDIKRIIAYSTLSQLGYMMIAVGVSAYAAGIFHLITHAFFKSLMFLAAGSAILAMHHDQNIFNMGNLKRYMPVTTVTMLIGTLALVGFPGTSGFFSKDLIIDAVQFSHLPGSGFAYWVAMFTVFLTSLYSFRLAFVVFHTKERMSEELRLHLHESPSVVTVPLVLLAIPSLLVGAFLIDSILGNFFQDSIFVLPQHNVLDTFKEEFVGAWHMFLHGCISLAFLMLILGLIVAHLCYVNYPHIPGMLQQRAKLLYSILVNKYGFDLFNEKIIMPATRALGVFCWRVGDVKCIDGYMVNGTAFGIGRVAYMVRNIQTGYLYHYIFITIAGLLALLLWTLYL